MKFFLYVQRKIKKTEDEEISINVIRIFCQLNYRKRIETEEAIQYTITILPGFLMPYSRVRVDLLFTAFTYYINGRFSNQYESALYISCSSRHSFSLYYKRIVNRIGVWYRFLEPQIENTNGLTDVSSVKHRWQSITCLMHETVISKSGGCWQVYLNALMCSNRMGLGP